MTHRIDRHLFGGDVVAALAAEGWARLASALGHRGGLLAGDEALLAAAQAAAASPLEALERATFGVYLYIEADGSVKANSLLAATNVIGESCYWNLMIQNIDTVTGTVSFFITSAGYPGTALANNHSFLSEGNTPGFNYGSNFDPTDPDNLWNILI